MSETNKPFCVLHIKETQERRAYMLLFRNGSSGINIRILLAGARRVGDLITNRTRAFRQSKCIQLVVGLGNEF